MKHVNEAGTHVFDDESNIWFGPFDDPQEAFSFAAEHQQPNEPNITEVDVASATAISTRLLVVSQGSGAYAQTPPMMLVPLNPARRRMLVSATPSQSSDQSIGVLIGARAEIIAGTGYFLAQSSRITLETTAEVWVTWPTSPLGPAAGQTNTTIVTALIESEQ